jgi:Ca-activated chloride channel homolog
MFSSEAEPRKGAFYMRHREQCRVIVVVALVCPCLALTISLAAAQNPPQPPPPEPANQQIGEQKKKSPQRQEAQTERQPQDIGGGSIKIRTEMVQLDVKVTDQSGHTVPGLTKDDFVVYEDKVSQNIESVSGEEAPVSMGLVIDTSSSMRPKLYTVAEATRGLIRQMRQDDEAFLVQFKTEAELVKEFTSDRRALEDALRNLYPSGGTALLDAIIATADHAYEKGHRRRKALVVITDGLEKNSSVKEKEVMEAMKADEVQVYLIGFIDKEESFSLFGASRKAKNLLTRLAEDSGGRAFFPTDVKETLAIAAQIDKDLRAQYVISYYPNNEKRDGSFRTVRVALSPKDNRKLILRTRQGYYARDDNGMTQGQKGRKLQ